jgi:hypothetical protein
MEQISAYIRESQAEIIRSLHEETWDRDDIPRIDSEAEIIRLLLDLGIDALDSGEAEVDLDDVDISAEMLSDLLPDHAIIEHRRETRKKETKPLFRGSKIAERFGDKADEMFSGESDEKATPGVMETIAESYLGELEDNADVLDQESLDRQRRAIRSRVERYREEYRAATHAPRETMRATPEEAEIGAEVERLKDNRERFVEQLIDKAETERYSNPEDLMRALATEHGVSEQSVELVIDGLTPPGSDGRQSLKNGSGVEIPRSIRALAPSQPEELPEESEQLPGYAGGSQPMRIQGVDPEEVDD